MKRIAIMLSILLVPFLAAHLVLAAGLFKVGEKAPLFTLTTITGETVPMIAITIINSIRLNPRWSLSLSLRFFIKILWFPSLVLHENTCLKFQKFKLF